HLLAESVQPPRQAGRINHRCSNSVIVVVLYHPLVGGQSRLKQMLAGRLGNAKAKRDALSLAKPEAAVVVVLLQAELRWALKADARHRGTLYTVDGQTALVVKPLV